MVGVGVGVKGETNGDGAELVLVLGLSDVELECFDVAVLWVPVIDDLWSWGGDHKNE